MNLIYSDMLPVQLKDGQQSIVDCLKEQFAIASEVEIAVGYVSKASMLELDAWIEEMNILILSILVYTFFSRMFDLMLPPVAKHSIVVA